MSIDPKLIVQLALECLTEKQRKRYTLYLHGLSLTEIAKQEGVSIVAIYFSVNFSKKKIKKRINSLQYT